MATQSQEERTPKTQAKHKSEKFIFILSKKHCLSLFVMFAIITYYRQKSRAFLNQHEKKAK
jgi:hypothetical protein